MVFGLHLFSKKIKQPPAEEESDEPVDFTSWEGEWQRSPDEKIFWEGEVVRFETEDSNIQAKASLMQVKQKVKIQFPDGVVEILIRKGMQVFELDDNTEWKRARKDGLSLSPSPTPFLAESHTDEEPDSEDVVIEDNVGLETSRSRCRESNIPPLVINEKDKTDMKEGEISFREPKLDSEDLIRKGRKSLWQPSILIHSSIWPDFPQEVPEKIKEPELSIFKETFNVDVIPMFTRFTNLLDNHRNLVDPWKLVFSDHLKERKGWRNQFDHFLWIHSVLKGTDNAEQKRAVLFDILSIDSDMIDDVSITILSKIVQKTNPASYEFSETFDQDIDFDEFQEYLSKSARKISLESNIFSEV